MADLLRDLFDRVIGHLLSSDPTAGSDTEEHAPTPVIEHRAQCAHRLTALAGGRFELQRLGFAKRCPGIDLIASDHGDGAIPLAPSSRSTR